MITHKKKNEKTTEIYFDETPAAVGKLLGKGKQAFLQSGVVRSYHDCCGCFIKIDFGCFFILFLVCNHKVLLNWLCF